MSTVTIFHNPACGTSRNTLALIRASGVEPEPSEAVLEILPARLAAPFTKEDGDVVVDHGERRG